MPSLFSPTKPDRPLRRLLIIMALLVASLFVLAFVVTFAGILLLAGIEHWQQRIACALTMTAMQALATTPADDYATEYDKCLTDTGGINNGTVEACSSAVDAKVKREMNAIYGRLHARLKAQSPGDADKLEDTQIAWLAYRNGQCGLATTYVGSPMHGYCPMMLNIQRLDELKEMAGQ